MKIFFKVEYVKGNNIKKTTVHLQKASEIGGTYSTPPLATIMFVAINIGCTNNNMYGKRLLFFVVEGFIKHHDNYYSH